MLDNTVYEPEEVEIQQPAPRPRSKGFRFVLFLVFSLFVCALAFLIYNGIMGRVRAESSLKEQTGQMAIPTVSVVHPKVSDAAEAIVLPGNIQAFTDSPIYARISGYLKKWHVDIGAHVKAGQLLAEIETPEIDQQLRQVRADLATAQANLALARSTATRYQFLLKTDSVSQQETDDKTGDLNAKKAMVDAAVATVRRLEETQGFQKIYAPFDGVITARNTDIGAFIDSGANTPGKELFHEASTGQLRVFVSVPQVYSRAAKVGSAADLSFNEFPGRRFRGTLVRTTDSIDPTSRTLLTEIDVNNESGELFPGAYTSVHLKLPSKVRALTLPVNTLLFRSEGLRVAVIRNGRAQLVPFTMGRDFGNEVEVVNGLRPADAVIVNPADSLTTGTEVHAASGGAE